MNTSSFDESMISAATDTNTPLAEQLLQAVSRITEQDEEDDTPIEERPPIGQVEKVRIAGTDVDVEVIRVPPEFAPQPGMKLVENMIVDKEIGGGVQGSVWSLKDNEGNRVKQLLKVMKYKAAVGLTGLDIGLEREWLIGQMLNTLRGSPDEDLPGFMGTGAAVQSTEDGNPMMGLLIEKVNGCPVEKRLGKDPSFNNIQYFLEMCRQVFIAIDKAGMALGFEHNDLNTANIMEHRPDDHDTTPYIPHGYRPEEDDVPPAKLQLPGDQQPEELRFKIIDYGHSRLHGNKAPTKLPEAPALEKSYRMWWVGKGDVWRLLQDLADSLDGRSWPVECEDAVLVLLSLIKKVTGVTVAAFFTKDGQEDHAVEEGGVKLNQAWHHLDGMGHDLRRARMRLQAFQSQAATLSAREALDFLETAQAAADKRKLFDDIKGFTGDESVDEEASKELFPSLDQQA